MSALPTAGPLDEDLAARIAAGDEDAFAELYRRYARPLAAYAGRILRDSAAGEDVAQVSLFNAYQALQRGSTPTFVRAWLYRIARNAALEAIEKRGDVVPLDDRDTAFEEPLDAYAARADLVAAVRALPERQRNVYALRELQGLRVTEIAERLDLATEQVEQALFAARNKLAERLEFGERLDCASVQSLAEARLSRTQRRAVKSHLRSCTACRSSSGLRVGVLALPLGWLRDGAAALFGGGAAKAAAVVAAAAAAGAIPVVAQHPPHIPLPVHSHSAASTGPRPSDSRVAPTGAETGVESERSSFAPHFLGTATPLVVPPALAGKIDAGNGDEGTLVPSRRAESSVVETEPAAFEPLDAEEPQQPPVADEPAREAEPLPDERPVEAEPEPAREEPVQEEPVREEPVDQAPAAEPAADATLFAEVAPEAPTNAQPHVRDGANDAPDANAAP
jgi:RNA polymerase sigma-70 factor (ECF subfamily)